MVTQFESGENGGERSAAVRVELSTPRTRSSRRVLVLSMGSGEREGIVSEMNVVLMAENRAACDLL